MTSGLHDDRPTDEEDDEDDDTAGDMPTWHCLRATDDEALGCNGGGMEVTECLEEGNASALLLVATPAPPLLS